MNISFTNIEKMININFWNRRNCRNRINCKNRGNYTHIKSIQFFETQNRQIVVHTHYTYICLLAQYLSKNDIKKEMGKQ